MSSFRKFGAFVRVQRGASEIFEKQKLQPPTESQLGCYRSFVISIIYIWSVASFRISADSICFGGPFVLEPSWILKFQLQPTTVLFGFLLIGIATNFWSIDLESSSFAAVLRGVSFKQLATRTLSLAAILPVCYCFVLPALFCCNVNFKVNLLRISLTYYPVRLWMFHFVNIMPSSSKSPQAPSTKTHSFLWKSTDESPSFKTTSISEKKTKKTKKTKNN